MTSVLIAEDLTKTYMLGNVTVNALNGVNLEVNSGEFVAVLGPSGSGKSTLLHMLGALDRPTSGTVQVDGLNISNLNDNQLSVLRRKIGVVFQFFNLINFSNAIENVEIPMSILNIPKKERRKRATDLLEVVGLGSRMYHKPSELSGGERQRVALARALANEPSYLLMDEPTGNIDSKTAKELMSQINSLHKERGVTIILVTHDKSLTKFADRTVHLLDGVIVRGGGK